jgi:K319L-like, PKD domain
MLIVGPTSGANGFPVWYKDENGLRLQLNVDPNDPYSGLTPEDIPDPSRPVSFPDNFPAESFYFAAEAEMTTGTGERARLVLALEAAFVNGVPAENEQIVFGRVRIRVSGLLPNVEYTVRHPYGVDTFVAEPDPGNPGLGEINFTEDIGGMNGGDFDIAANSRIQPFLRWDPNVVPTAPEGYIGDPNVLHPVIGSLFVDPQGQPQNYFRMEGPGIGIGSPDRSTTPGIDPDNCIETRNFSVLGKISFISGVDVTRATYSRVEAAGGFLDVFATSDDTPQNIVLSGPGFEPTTMQGSQGRYFAHVFFAGEPPVEVIVTNVSDQPDSVKTATPVDLVSGTSVYNTDTDELTVTAQSSDEFGAPALTAVGYGTIPPNGTLIVPNLAFVSAFVTVSSSEGGQLTLPVLVEGSPFNPIGVQANAGEDQTVLIGAQVTLDGTNSSGPIASYQWAQVSGTPVALSGEDAAIATFTAPNSVALLEFTLTVTGPGGPSTDTVFIVVLESSPAPVADAGPDQTVRQGTVVTLSGSSSTAPVNYRWEQISGIAVQLNGDDTPNPTFMFPKQTQPLVFRLTVTGPGGSSSDTVQIVPLPDNLAVTRAEFRTRDSEWRIEGTSDVFGPGVTITIYLGNGTSGNVLAQVNVDAIGLWIYRVQGAATQPDGTRAITVQSSSGGLLSSVPLTIRQ